MSWLKSSEEIRSGGVLENPRHPLAQPLLFMDGERTATGRSVNEGRALAVAAVYNAVTVIAGTLATIPLKVYARSDDGGRNEEPDHPLATLLGLSPSPQITSTSWREATQGWVLLRGNGFAQVVRNSRGDVTELIPYTPREITRNGNVYRVESGQDRKILGFEEVLHIAGPGDNGVDGYSVIKLARESLGLASALEESNARFIGKGARPSGILTTDSAMKPETLKKLKEQFGRNAAGLDNVGGAIVLDGGWNWQQISLSAEDSQFMQSRSFSVTEVARWFNISPHLIKDLERATFSNIEQLAIEFVEHTLRPWAVRWEQAMNMRLLSERERRSGLFIRFNLDGLLRGDAEARASSLSTQYNAGAITINEWRALENRNPVEGGDEPRVRLDTVSLDSADDVQMPAEPNAEPDNEPDENERAEVRAVREIRSPEMRLQLRNSFGPLILGAAGRMVRGEVRNIRRLLKGDGFGAALERYYYDDHPEFASGVMGPVFRAYAEAVASVAAIEIDTSIRIDAPTFADMYTETFVADYSAWSRRDLQKVEQDEVEQRLSDWVEGTETSAPRSERVAKRETVELGDAVARQVFVAGGMLSLVWRTLGDTCPYCVRLAGRRVDIRTPFIGKGESFEGEGDVVPLVPKRMVRHAPAHTGCDCYITPGQ